MKILTIFLFVSFYMPNTAFSLSHIVPGEGCGIMTPFKMKALSPNDPCSFLADDMYLPPKPGAPASIILYYISLKSNFYCFKYFFWWQ
jgi:hypothetical protein